MVEGICCDGGLADSLHTYTHGSMSIGLADFVVTTENILCVDRDHIDSGSVNI